MNSKKAKYIVSKRSEVAKQTWDAFVERSDEAWLWHRYDLQDALLTWGRIDVGFAVCDAVSGEFLALVPLQLLEAKTLRLIPWNSLDSFGGPALKNGLGSKHRSKLHVFIRDTLLNLAQQYNVAKINLALSPLSPASRGDNCPRVNPLLHLGCQNTLTQTWILDLQQSEIDIRRSYSTLTTRELNRIHRSDVEIYEASGHDDLDIYYDLHCETYYRTGVRPHPYTYFEKIFTDFVANGLSRIVFLRADGRVVAAQNTALYKKCALYWTGASRSDKLPGANRALFDNQIFFAREIGCIWYETGEAFPNVERGKLKGLNDFKRSFGSELYPFYRGQIITKKKVHGLRALYDTMRG